MLQTEFAVMQQVNWNDFRYVLAIGRGGTLTAAARLLGVDDTTVARRLTVLTDAVGTNLYRRAADKTLHLTSMGKQVARRAANMQREVDRIDCARDEAPVSDIVRLTSVPIIVNRLLAPAVAALSRRHPQLQLELFGDGRDFDLLRREADLALRLARPKTGGTKLVARRVGALRYAVYAAASCPVREANALPWVTYDETRAHLPQARWIAAAIRGDGARVAPVRLNDAEAVLETVISGAGRSLLPCAVGDADPRLRRLDDTRGASLPTRELWLIMPAELRKLKRIRAVAGWIEETLR
jgi:DNA-binding transcriptional LysR family regulator